MEEIAFYLKFALYCHFCRKMQCFFFGKKNVVFYTFNSEIITDVLSGLKSSTLREQNILRTH